MEYYAKIINPQKQPSIRPADQAVSIMQRLAYPVQEKVRGVVYTTTMTRELLKNMQSHDADTDEFPDTWDVRDVHMEPGKDIEGREVDTWDEYETNLKEKGIGVYIVNDMHDTRWNILRTYFSGA